MVPNFPDVDVAICTHNPRADILDLCIQSLANQTAPKDSFRVLLVDSASASPIGNDILAPLLAAGIEARIVREEQPGLTKARLRTAEETSLDWLLFVDDDNELASDYIEVGLNYLKTRDNIGCFGGRLLQPDYLDVPDWATPFLPYLGIRDYGDEEIIEKQDRWGFWEPAGAGAWVSRAIMELFVRRLEVDVRLLKLGRTGALDLSSCDDSLMMRGAYPLGLYSAYQPDLRLTHHIAQRRLEYGYLLPLLAAYGKSHIMLESFLSGEVSGRDMFLNEDGFQQLLASNLENKDLPLRFRVAMAAYFVTARNQVADLVKEADQSL